MMKKFLFIFAFLLVLSSAAVLAEEEAGTTPDSPLWGLDVAFDKLSLALTANDQKRADKALAIAEERLSEIKQMVEEQKLEQSEKAKVQHDQIIEKLELQLEKPESGDDQEQYQRQIEIETKLQEHKENVEAFKAKIEIEGELTPDQQEKLDALLASLGDRVNQVEIKIKNQKDETKLRLEATLSDEQIEALEGDRYEHLALLAQDQAQREITKAEGKIAEFEKEYQARLEKTLRVEPKDMPLVPREEIKERVEERIRDPEDREDMMDDMMGDDEDEADSENDEERDAAGNVITGQVTGNDDEEADKSDDDAKEEDEDELETDETESEIEDESDDLDDDEDNILRQYGLVAPRYEERGVDISKDIVSQARDALLTSKNHFQEGDFKAAYAYAVFSRKLANDAVGHYLHLTDAQEAALDRLKDREDMMDDLMDDDDEDKADSEDEDEKEDDKIECTTDTDCDADEYCQDNECEDLDEEEDDRDDDDNSGKDDDSNDEKDDSGDSEDDK
ncbi:MAG: hypothetical protein KC535_02525 [Nanoarchaeota archaeon]|nr:hypothetical protein [Nanoarchaeota archaeon]